MPYICIGVGYLFFTITNGKEIGSLYVSVDVQRRVPETKK